MKTTKEKLASLLYSMGLSANTTSVLGLFFAALSGLLIYKGYFFWASGFLFLSGGLDLLDGAIARISKTTKPFGGILDSTLDRYGDGFVYAGLIFFCVSYGAYLYAALAVSAMLGSFAISYVRARSECVIKKCKVGFWERGERTVYIALGLLVGNITVPLWVLGIATHLTAGFRLYYASRSPEAASVIETDRNWARNLMLHTSGRNNIYYYLKCGILFLAVMLLRLPF